jgi:thiamine biosynthesis lipoprotein
VGVRNPRGGANDIIGTVRLSDMCAATSGDYERFFEKDGIRYHHIFDAKTGFPADSGLISVTIISESGADCDALSTTCFLLGLVKSIELLKDINAEAIFVDDEKNVYITDGLKDNFEFRGSDKGFTMKNLQTG